MNQQQTPLMVGMQGGPVSAAPPMMGGPGVGGPNNASNNQGSQEILNTYIYDHLCKMKLWDLARSFCQSVKIKSEQGTKKEEEMNGVDAGGDGRPEDLPLPSIPPHYSDTSFLFDWWNQFWDIYGSARHRGSAMGMSYYGNVMTQSKMRQQSQQSLMGMNANMMANRAGSQQFPGMQQPNGMNHMQKQAMASRNGNMQQMMAANKMQQNNMQDGDRPQSPGSMVNAPSPSKRPRLDDAQFNGQPNQAGRGQPMPGNQVGNMPGGPNGMMMQNGMAPDMNQLNFAQNGQKMDMSGVPPQGMDGANPQQGNHALQDYQMQLMLLEQQNKKRLLMARQEQDNINHVPASSQPGQMQFAGAPGMSPNGRPGPSPNPQDQMKRMAQTPKMGPGNMPGSPAMAGGENRASPVPGGQFDQNNIPPQMRAQMFQQNMMQQGQPPSSHPQFQMMQMNGGQPMNVEQMRMAQARAQQAGFPNGQPFPPGQQPGGTPMMQTGSQTGQVGTPQQRPGNMPPPPAPNAENQRTQPSSPAQAAGPPTPSQANKPAPKGKKDTAKKKGAAANKKDNSATAATPAAPADAATPTPATPITPMHNKSFAQQNQGANATAPPSAPPQQQPPPQQQQQVPAAPAQSMGGLSDGLDFAADGAGFDLSFAGADGPDVLENFDFDSFLHNTDDSGGFGSFDFMTMGLDNEATAGS